MNRGSTKRNTWIIAALAVGVLSFGFLLERLDGNRRVVQVSAYNSLPGQALGNPQVGAWGDRIEPGMKVIAVSRDLIEQGLTHGTPVRIEGFSDEYFVMDKMAARWNNKIDIYMGVDREAAAEFGVRELEIRW